jgi:hypothetical protein
MFNQVQKIAAKFGGARRLASAIGVDPSNVYRWGYPKTKPGGGGGVIPREHIAAIKGVARNEGILLTDGDWSPEPVIATLPPELE